MFFFTVLSHFSCFITVNILFLLQSTPVISKSKGPSEILRDIRTSTDQMCTTDMSNFSCFITVNILFLLQSTPVISKSKGPSEILRDIRTSTYQMCTTEENINRTTKFHK